MTILNGITMYDAIMAMIVFFTTIHGFWKGAAWQIAPIMSLVLGYMIAMPMSVTSAHYFGDPPQNRLYALVTIYLGVALIVYLLVRSFRAGIEKAKLTEFDRHIGALLGLLKGVLLTLSITVILLIQSTAARDLILKSESSTIAAKIINAVYPILPKAMLQILHPYLHELEDDLPLNLHDSDYELNPGEIPEPGNTLTPTHSTVRRAQTEDFSPTPRRRSRQLVDEDEQGLPPAPPPRRRQSVLDDSDPNSTSRDRSEPRDNRRYDSAASSNRRYPTEDRRSSDDAAAQPLLSPTTPADDDPFSPRSSSRSRPRR